MTHRGLRPALLGLLTLPLLAMDCRTDQCGSFSGSAGAEVARDTPTGARGLPRATVATTPQRARRRLPNPAGPMTVR